MKRFTGILTRTKSQTSADFSHGPVDSPEANAGRSVRLFCESAGPSNRDDEVLHLPVIVEAAESSPQAAASAAHHIKHFLHKSYTSKPHVQYNAIMLVRILSDNPGATFTRNFDLAFVKTIKDLLRGCKDQSTQQILRETLDALEVSKGYDEGLQLLLQMWRKEKGGQASLLHQPDRRAGQQQNYRVPPPFDPTAPPQPPSQQQSNQRVFSQNQLPPPHELAGRIEEARNTAKILLQLIQSTPQEDVMQNELLREFSERCQSAQKGMQGYINCDSPAPDDDTMLTLIETNEQLALAGSRFQRAVLAARRAMGANVSPNPEAMSGGYGMYSSTAAAGQREGLAVSPPFMPEPEPNEAVQSSTQQTDGFGSIQQTDGFGRTQQTDGFGSTQQTDGFGSTQQTDGYGSRNRPQTVDFNTFDGAPQQSFASAPSNGFGSPLRTQTKDSLYESDTYQAPPGPPPQHMLNSLQQRHLPPPPPSDQRQPTLPSTDGPSDPFMDPMEYHDNSPPLALEPTNYGSSSPPNRMPKKAVPSQQFIASSLASLPSVKRRNTTDLENAYNLPKTAARKPSTVSAVSAPSPTKSAAEGLTMHGAGSNHAVSELDGHSQVGRRDTVGTDSSSAAYPLRPVVGTGQ